MSIFKRFASNRPGSHLHTSGIVGNSQTMGAASAESFAQRQQVDSQRQHVANYRDAGVVHNYRKNAGEARVASRHSDTDDKKHPKKRSRDEIIPRTSRVENRPTSRIDAAHTPRGSAPSVPQPSMPTQFRPSFSEPTSRKYNPYA